MGSQLAAEFQGQSSHGPAGVQVLQWTDQLMSIWSQVPHGVDPHRAEITESLEMLRGTAGQVDGGLEGIFDSRCSILDWVFRDGAEWVGRSIHWVNQASEV